MASPVPLAVAFGRSQERPGALELPVLGRFGMRGDPEDPPDAVKNSRRDDVADKTCCAGGLVAATSSFSIQYNYGAASIAVAIMLSSSDTIGPGVEPDFPEPQWAKECLLGLVFVGSVVGMLVMGYLGDQIGVHRALVVANSLVVFGALTAALGAWGSQTEIWSVIAVSRFLLGVGVGGNYPLSAKKASMSSSPTVQEAPMAIVLRTARAFSWQSPGSVAPYFVALLLLRLPHTQGVTSVQFRVLFALGAVPALFVTLVSWREYRQSTMTIRTDEDVARQGASSEALKDPRHWKALIGTAGTWCLFDVAYYGTVIFTPIILAKVFHRQTLTTLSIRSAAVGCIGVLGVQCGVFLLPRIGAKALNTAGLAIAGILFTVLMITFQYHDDYHNALFLLLCMLVFVLAGGPNVATFVLPVLAFPPEVRSTFHGLSSAWGKVGAMGGSFIFPFINDTAGTAGVMGVQALFCAAAALLSHYCLASDADHLPLPEEDGTYMTETGSTISGSMSFNSRADDDPIE